MEGRTLEFAKQEGDKKRKVYISPNKLNWSPSSFLNIPISKFKRGVKGIADIPGVQNSHTPFPPFGVQTVNSRLLIEMDKKSINNAIICLGNMFVYYFTFIIMG